MDVLSPAGTVEGGKAPSDPPDRLTIEGWYRGPAAPVQAFETAKGDVLRAKQVEQLVQAMAAFEPPPLSAQATLKPPAPQAQLGDILAAAFEPPTPLIKSMRT